MSRPNPDAAGGEGPSDGVLAASSEAPEAGTTAGVWWPEAYDDVVRRWTQTPSDARPRKD